MIYNIPISHRLSKQFDILNKKIGFLSRTKTEDHINALNEIAKIGLPYDVSYLFHLVFSKNKAISNAAVATITILLKNKDKKHIWFRLYDSFRYITYNPKDLKFLGSFPEEQAAHLLGIVSLNHNGYAREQAIILMSSLDTMDIIPYLMLRLNDWVPQVSKTAKKEFKEKLSEIPIYQFIKYYQLVDWLKRTKRVDLKDIQIEIHRHICSVNNREQLLVEIEKAEFKEKLFCWKILKSEEQVSTTLIEIALQDKAPEIRQWAACNLPIDGRIEARTKQLLLDRAVRVKYTALKTISSDKLHNYQAVLEEAIFDDYRPIREYSKFVLKSVFDIQDFLERYIKQLQQIVKPNIGIIMGIGETGKKEDVVILRPFLNSKISKIRAATFLALNKLNAQDMESLYIEGLNDTGKIRRACTVILSNKRLENIDKIYHIFKNGNISAQKSALKILATQKNPETICYILNAALSDNKDIKELAHNYLEQWYRYYSAYAWLLKFDNETCNKIQTLWKKVKPTIDINKNNLDHLISNITKK